MLNKYSFLSRSLNLLFKLNFLLLATFVSEIANANQNNLIISWNASTSPNIDYYNIFSGKSINNLQHIATTPSSVLTATINNLTPGETYLFGVRAVNTSGISSNFSNIISYTVPFDDNGENNDGDNDLTPNTPIPNGNVSGSDIVKRSELGTTICAPWNGFLNLSNFFERVNLSNENRNVVINLFGIDGSYAGGTYFTVPPNAQFDAPINLIQGFKKESYGVACATHDGHHGDMDGRMSHYLPAADGAPGYDFAFNFPDTNGRVGKQFLSFNTFQPSLNNNDVNNLAANWISITYLGNRTSSNIKSANGRLIFYDMNGFIIQESEINSITKMQRFDFDAHRFGPSLVGTVEWRPNNSNDIFLVNNVRYYYDNTELRNSFDTAFPIHGVAGTKESVVIPFDTENATSIIEIFNTSNIPNTAIVVLNDSNGATIKSFTLTEDNLPAHGAYHLILDSVVGSNKKGTAIIYTTIDRELSAIGMQYQRRNDLGIRNIYGILGNNPYEGEVTGSWNTYISINSQLILSNQGMSKTVFKLNLKANDGTQISTIDYEVSALGIAHINLNQFTPINNYGTINIQNSGFVSAYVLRTHPDFSIPTLIR